MQQANIYQQYKSQALETLTNSEIVVKLFEEASKQVSMAIFLTKQNNSVRSFNCILKAQKIIKALNASLDMKYAISLELNDMYLFLYEKLAEVNVTKDIDLMKELLLIIDEFKTTFAKADKLARLGRV